MIIHIGCSGWSYPSWKGDIYPKDSPSSKWFEHYSKIFNSVELNSTFYHLPLERTIKKWEESAPPNFYFAAKASRLITHYKRLLDCKEALDTYYERILGLKKKLGPILFQLPPQFERDDERLVSFLELLPRNKKITHIFEFRNNSWWTKEIYDILGKYNVGFCVYHKIKEKTPVVVTNDHFYMRFHGTLRGFRGCYSNRQLHYWAKKISESGAKQAWIYFNNTADNDAPIDAMRLWRILTM